MFMLEKVQSLILNYISSLLKSVYRLLESLCWEIQSPFFILFHETVRLALETRHGTIEVMHFDWEFISLLMIRGISSVRQ